MQKLILGMMIFLLLGISCEAGQVTITLSAEEEADVAALALAQQISSADILRDIIIRGLITEKQQQQQANEAALLEKFRQRSLGDQQQFLQGQGARPQRPRP